MELVEGLTLAAGSPRHREAGGRSSGVFVAAGRGLAAAHAAGLVHRDFKPETCWSAATAGPRHGLRPRPPDRRRNPLRAHPPRAAPPHPMASRRPRFRTVTQAGTVIGTPAYMAPEQFRGDPADARSDQFSFCVALYEALYGVRPFRGEHLLSLTFSVTEGELRPADDAPSTASPSGSAGRSPGSPPRPRRPLFIDAGPDRQAGGRPCGQAPASPRRRRRGCRRRRDHSRGLANHVPAPHRRRARDRRHVDEATRATLDARKAASEARTLRQEAFAAFDRPDRRNGELLWRQARALLPRADTSYDRAERSLETAFTLNPSREQHRSGLADLRFEHLCSPRISGSATRRSCWRSACRRGSRRRPAQGARRAGDAGAAHPTARFTHRSRALRSRPDDWAENRAAGRTPRRLPRDDQPGPRVLSPPARWSRARARRLPVGIKRGERTVANLDLPPASAVPTGFAYVPAGTFWFGDADEQLRTQFLDAVPIHRRTTKAYVIARHETTYQDWITFLDDLPRRKGPATRPLSRAPARGALVLKARDDGWHIAIQPSSRRYEAKLHEPISYVGRHRRSSQDWARFPIGGVSPDDVMRYLGVDTGERPSARCPLVLRAGVGTRSPRCGQSAVSSWRRNRQRRRKHRHHLRTNGRCIWTRRDRLPSRIRAARSKWRTWPATSWRLSRPTRSPVAS